MGANTQVLQKLSEKHEILAHLFAGGLTNVQVHSALAQMGTGYSLQYIKQLRNEPLMRTRIKELQAEHLGQTMQGVLNSLFMQAQPSIEKLTELRDSAADETVQLRAAQGLLGHVVDYAKAQARGDEDHNKAGQAVHVHISAEHMGAIAAAMKEAGIAEVEIEATEVEPLEFQPIPVQTIAELEQALPAETGVRGVTARH